jgi:hypothetical protein
MLELMLHCSPVWFRHRASQLTGVAEDNLNGCSRYHWLTRCRDKMRDFVCFEPSNMIRRALVARQDAEGFGWDEHRKLLFTQAIKHLCQQYVASWIPIKPSVAHFRALEYFPSRIYLRASGRHFIDRAPLGCFFEFLRAAP